LEKDTERFVGGFWSMKKMPGEKRPSHKKVSKEAAGNQKLEINFLAKLLISIREAGKNEGQTLEQARASLLEHFGHAYAATLTFLREKDGIDDISIVLQHLLSSNIEKDNHLSAELRFTAALILVSDFVNRIQKAPYPDWLLDQASRNYTFPWMMTNGSPAPGFAELDAVLSQKSFIKRGKSQFVSPQTRDVARALSMVNHYRTFFQYSLDSLELFCRNKPESASAAKQYAALPPFSNQTKNQWWPHIREMIRSKPQLSEKERQTILATLSYKTNSALVSEYLNRCRKAFDGLCPGK
jgi:hypothetical protein